MDLHERVQRAAERWGLDVGAALTGGSRSAVFGARDEAGRDLVLKLPAARGDGRAPATTEAAALTSWAGTRAAVTLLDATSDALLLERARPGRSWPWHHDRGSIDHTVDVAAMLLGRLWAAPAAGHDFPLLGERYPEDERIAREDAAAEQDRRGEPDRGRTGVVLLPAARTAAERLWATAGEVRLLHGDFITKNLVSDRSSLVGWVALDPLPVWGDPAAEVAAFAAYQPAGLILPVAEALARRLGLDVGRALRWTAVWSVHQAAQSWRYDQAEIDGLVSSGPVSGLLRT